MSSDKVVVLRAASSLTVRCLLMHVDGSPLPSSASHQVPSA